MNTHAPIVRILFQFLVMAVPTLALAQGSLTQPGAPGPTMKSLDQLDAKLEKRTPISSPSFPITQPGSYYLTTNLVVASGYGIRVEADDVSLDLAGWTLTGLAGSTEGISTFVRTNITVRNGTVREFSGMGVYLGGISGAKVEGVTAVGNLGRGIYVGDGSAVIDCAAIRNGSQGIETGANCEVRACRSLQNAGSGFLSSANTAFQDSLAANNAQIGFEVGQGGSLRGCVARSNTNTGILTAENASLSDCSAQSNGGAGMATGRGSFIRDCENVRTTHSFATAPTAFSPDSWPVPRTILSSVITFRAILRPIFPWARAIISPSPRDRTSPPTSIPL